MSNADRPETAPHSAANLASSPDTPPRADSGVPLTKGPNGLALHRPRLNLERDAGDAAGASDGSVLSGPEVGREERDGRSSAVSVRRGDLPEPLQARYTAEETALGGMRFYSDPERREFAFRDSGTRLTTRLESPAIVRDLVGIARHRGWDEVTLQGSEAFRRLAWREAELIGVAVKGYTPTQRDSLDLADARERHAGGRPRDASIAGRFIESGTAPYAGRADASISPFVVVEREGGQRETVWGAGLPGAIAEAGVRLGDDIVLRRGAPTRVVLTIKDQGLGVSESPGQQEVLRNTWTIEKRGRALLSSKARDDDLTPGARSQLRVVEAVVQANIKDPAARAAIMDTARRYVLKELDQGRSFPIAVVRENQPLRRERLAAERVR